MLGALFSIIIISLFIIENEDKWQASYACSRLEEFKNEDYNGIVLRKYTDQKNHRAKTIGLSKKTMVFARDTSDFFNFIQKMIPL